MESKAKSEQVASMFDSIAHKYDSLNHILSFGIDKIWRRKGLNQLKKDSPKNILDIATGTGDLAFRAKEILQPDSILGIDISEQMLQVAQVKSEKKGYSDIIRFDKQSCMHLNLADNSFDAAIVAFGVRNFEDLKQGFREILRVLKPEGKLMILELTTPQSFPMKQLYFIYSKLVIPTAGRLVSKSETAYTYLPNTIKAFVQGEALKQILLECGFSSAEYKKYTFGICTMYLAKK